MDENEFGYGGKKYVAVENRKCEDCAFKVENMLNSNRKRDFCEAVFNLHRIGLDESYTPILISSFEKKKKTKK